MLDENQLMYDSYSFETCPWCNHYVNRSNYSVCPNCHCPVGKFNVFLRNIFNESYLSYGITYENLSMFNLSQHITTINMNNADYYQYITCNQTNIIINRYLNEIIKDIKLMDRFNSANSNFNVKNLVHEIGSNPSYVYSLIMSLWIFAINSIKYINRYYGQNFLKHPNVTDLDNDKRLFYKFYHQIYRSFKEHAGEIYFQKKFEKFERKYNNSNNFLFILHNKSLKDDFGHSYNTNTTTQMDIIIICNKGIIIPEIKNYRNPFYVDKRGQLHFENESKDNRIFNQTNRYNVNYSSRPNFAKQIDNHSTAMNDFLINKYNDAPIHVESFLVNVNKAYNPKNYYKGHLNIYNLKDCFKHINRLPINTLLNNSKIKDIKDEIKKSARRERPYAHLLYNSKGLCHIGTLLHYINVVIKLRLFGYKIYKMYH